MEEVYIVSGVRTAVGDFGGSLKSFMPSDLGGLVATEALARAGIEADAVEHVVIGQVMPTSARDQMLARVIGINAGIPLATPALTLNRLCGSGVQAIVSAAQMMKLGEASVTLAGGAEVMSNIPYHDHGVRWGRKMGANTQEDALTLGLSDAIGGYHMGITAENVAERHCVSREDMDALAATSHARAAHAIAEGRFKDQILPVEVKTRKGVTVFDTDEHVKADTTVEVLGKMRPAFKKDGTVTAGNASGINDGAAAVVLATGAEVEKRGLKPLARIVAWGHAGVEPEYMGEGPIQAVPIALKRAGLSLDQMDVIESNEAFAAQAAAVAKVLGFDPAKVNPNGSGVSIGHPVGATGTMLTIKAMYELKRIGGKYGLVTMCIGGGQGIALVIENVIENVG
ncbi:acetyl-CoA acetyltransferase [Sphingomonas sp. LH128]|uniref:Acetyl-CoA acetyltransferase n=1 Tax=Novosphingobium resinovorum TaxID=158500 RepID=A0A031K7R7_9SPHN|nr:MULTISPECIES: beta-ketothiolase BktB [Sphingomonadaceae]EJU13811.1 acetyl-CoA acetyltransferase [Sphingomonas sp. LH128]EZP84662.1 Acetyl-CoA acetyltransferase [Novosphingobium resinovorum]